MRKKPRSRKYRNLYARGGVIYYERVVDGRRIKLSAKTDEAASFRDLYESAKGVGPGFLPGPEVPPFDEFAARYLAESTGHLAASTLEDRTGLLKPTGRLTQYFASYRLDDIGRATLLEWWNAEILARGLSTKTGKNHLDALSAVLGYALDLELIETNPCDTFRSTLRRRARTQRGRADSAPSANIRPIEKPEELAAFVAARSLAR